MAGYKFSDKNMQNVWLILSKDSFVCQDNLAQILQICRKNGIDDDSTTYFSLQKPDWDEIFDIATTPSFFGQRLIVLKDADITSLIEDDLAKLSQLIKDCTDNHLAIILTYEDDKKIKAKKYTDLLETASRHGIVHMVQTIDEKYLVETIIARAKKQDTVLPKETAVKIVENIGKDVGLLINETDKYCAACGYSEITQKMVDEIGVKTVEASVFDIIELICRKKPIKAIEKLNSLFDMRADEISILGALTSGFVNMHRCKMAAGKGIRHTSVHQDFEKNSNPYRYQKAMSNANNFTLTALDEIIALLMQADISMKTSSADNRQILYVLTTQIIAKGLK